MAMLLNTDRKPRATEIKKRLEVETRYKDLHNQRTLLRPLADGCQDCARRQRDEVKSHVTAAGGATERTFAIRGYGF